jgi:phage baseplate assembly protein W
MARDFGTVVPESLFEVSSPAIIDQIIRSTVRAISEHIRFIVIKDISATPDFSGNNIFITLSYSLTNSTKELETTVEVPLAEGINA